MRANDRDPRPLHYRPTQLRRCCPGALEADIQALAPLLAVLERDDTAREAEGWWFTPTILRELRELKARIGERMDAISQEGPTPCSDACIPPTSVLVDPAGNRWQLLAVQYVVREVETGRVVAMGEEEYRGLRPVDQTIRCRMMAAGEWRPIE